MANIKTLKDLTPGTVFDAGPIDVRVLDHMTNGTTLLIADKAVAWRPFSLEPLKTRPEEAPTPYPNDFSLSYLKDELNGPFLAAFDTAGGPIRSTNIVEANWSLADHRGGFGYCHPYSSWERGTNENTNGLIRRWFPKGTDFSKVSVQEIQKVEDWLNTYPREILGFLSADAVFSTAFAACV